jgi:hypothetical protein
VRLHGLASSPTPDTQVLVACAWASEAVASNVRNAVAMIRSCFDLISWQPPQMCRAWRRLKLGQTYILR